MDSPLSQLTAEQPDERQDDPSAAVRPDDSSFEQASLERWLPRFWPIYCVLAALVTFGYALWDPYQIDGDSVTYNG